MKFCALALGTRGDVQPFLGVARALLKRSSSLDSSVVICAAECFRSLTIDDYCAQEAREGRLTFETCGLERIEQPPGWMTATSLAEFIAENAKMYASKYDEMGNSMVSACTGCDVILVNVFSQHIGMDIAESLGAKCVALKLTPDTTTWRVPPFGEEEWRWPLNAGIVTYVRYLLRTFAAIRASIASKYTDEQNKFRQNSLSLGPVTLSRFGDMRRMTTLYGFSSALFPKPDDWPSCAHVTGFWFADNPKRRSLSDAHPRLDAFVRGCCEKESDRPVCVTFGSMSVIDAAGCDVVTRCVEAVIDGLQRKCVLIRGWTRKDVAERLKVRFGDSLCVVDAVPHELLFKHCSCVVYHGGAGTTARVLQSGVPAVVVPILRWYDQLGWGICIERTGAGVCVSSAQQATSDVLEEAVGKVIKNREFADAAKAVAAIMAREGGAEAAARLVLESVSDE